MKCLKSSSLLSSEILRIIREDEPSKPSTRFNSIGDTSTDVAKKRSTSEVSMTKQLRGDLDWIVMKAIEKDRKRRYKSAADLATDIERYLNQEPIIARPPSMAYKVRKYVRRHKAATVAALLIISLSFLSILSVQSLNAQNRPFWTEKSCYVEFGVVYGVGVSLRKPSLEEARKAGFNAGVWEIANFAQITDTTLLFIETQMTYDEQNKDGTYSVWRLVKVPIEMLRNTKKALGSNNPIYQELGSKISQLENENQKEKADNLRRAVGMGRSVNELKRELQALTARVAKVEEKVQDIDKQVAALSQLFKELKYKKDNIEKVGEAEINWTKKLIRVKGYGASNKDFPAHVQRLSAQEAARVDAQTKLIEMAKGLKITSRTFIKNFQVQSDEKIKEVQGKIKGTYQIGETRYLPDGTAEILMEVNVKDVF